MVIRDKIGMGAARAAHQRPLDRGHQLQRRRPGLHRAQDLRRAQEQHQLRHARGARRLRAEARREDQEAGDLPQPDRRRDAAGRLAYQHRLRRRRLEERLELHHQKVHGHPAQHHRHLQLRRAHLADGRLPVAHRRGGHELLRLRRDGLRQDDADERADDVHPPRTPRSSASRTRRKCRCRTRTGRARSSAAR